MKCQLGRVWRTKCISLNLFMCKFIMGSMLLPLVEKHLLLCFACLCSLCMSDDFIIAGCRCGQAGICALQTPGSVPQHWERHTEGSGGPEQAQPLPHRQLPHPVSFYNEGVQPCVCGRPRDLHTGAPGCKPPPETPPDHTVEPGC